MVIPNAVAYGVLASIGLLVLVAFLVVFMRLERRPPKRIEHDQPARPLGWPISPEPSAALRPVRSRAAASRPDRS